MNTNTETNRTAAQEAALHLRDIASVVLDSHKSNWVYSLSGVIYSTYVYPDTEEGHQFRSSSDKEVDCLYLLLLAEAIEQGDL